jgi:hypothetical protein
MTIDSTGMPALRVRLGKGRSRAAMREVAGILVETADAARTWIQTHYEELFRHANPDPDAEDIDPEATLGGSLWRGDEPRPAADMMVELGWGVIHGRILEFGPKERGPKKIVVKRANALRIGTAGGVIYRKSSTYIWKPSMLRPHMMKAMDAVTPHMLERIAGAL